MWVHDVQLAVLNEDVVLFEIFTRGQFLSIIAALVVLILYIVVVLGWLLQPLVLVQEFRGRRLNFLLDFEFIVCTLAFNAGSQWNHPVALYSVRQVWKRTHCDLSLLSELPIEFILIKVNFESPTNLLLGLARRLHRRPLLLLVEIGKAIAELIAAILPLVTLVEDHLRLYFANIFIFLE